MRHDHLPGDGFVWRRQEFVVALLGEAACAFGPAVRAAGFRVVQARLAEAEQVFAPQQELSVIVVDFSDDERPPEAIPLLARAHPAGGRLLALVPGRDDASFRRAFVAGARDVVALPALIDDILRALDAIVEPVALRASFARLRQQAMGEGTVGSPAPEPATLEVQRVELIALAAQLAETQRELDRVREQAKAERSRLWTQLLELMQERDRALVSEGRGSRWSRAMSLDDEQERRRWELVTRENETLKHALMDTRTISDKLRQELEEAHRVLRRSSTLPLSRAGHDDHTSDTLLAEEVEGALERRSLDENRLAALEQLLARRAVLERQLRVTSEVWVPWSVDVEDDTRPELTHATEEDADSARPATQASLAEKEDLDEKVEALVAQLAEPTRPGLGHSLPLELSRLAEAYDDARHDIERLEAERRELLAERDELRAAFDSGHRRPHKRGSADISAVSSSFDGEAPVHNDGREDERGVREYARDVGSERSTKL